MSRAQLVDKTAQIPIMPPASRCSGACEGAGMGFSSSASHTSAAQAAGRDLCYSHLQPHIQRGKSSTPPSSPCPVPPQPPLWGHYLLTGRHIGERADAAGVRHHHGRGEARGVGILGRLLFVCVHCGEEGHSSGKSHPQPAGPGMGMGSMETGMG